MIERALESEGLRPNDIIPIEDVGKHSMWVPLVESLVPKFRVVYSNDPLTVRLFLEKGYEVRVIPLHKREEYSGTEIRNRIATGKKWEHLVPEAVAGYLEEIDGIRRIRDLGD
jgi:nicotinamide-nucleotide adenylyltransferase